jgi:23S rRNA-/tRNA-specific pseudouridylate synthase
MDWSPVHRLDRDTSGLVLFGRGREALSRLGRWFSERSVSKRYLALVHGDPHEDFLVDAPLGSAEDPRIQMRQGVRPDGKECQTDFRVLGPDAHGRGVWLEASPRQGRTHQIRAHLEFAGFPIFGDLLYDGRGGEAFLVRASGASSEDVVRMAGTERMWLHAWGLGLPEPRDDMPGLLICPLSVAPSLE